MQVEFLIVMLVVLEGHPGLWTRSEIETQLSDVQPLTISDALAHLETEEVLILRGEHIEGSRCARHLNTLGMLAI